MKRLSLFLIAFIILISCSCASIKKIDVTTITGLVEKIDFDSYTFSISENYESRSKINNCIIIKDSDENAVDTLRNSIGEVVTADVQIIKDDGLWLREVILLNIQ